MFLGGAMRFGNGAWRMLEDVKPIWPARVDAIEVKEDEILFHVSDRLEEARWATLEGHMFTLVISSPLEGVLRIRVTHYKGRVKKGPNFEVFDKNIPLKVSEDDTTIEVSTGNLRLIVQRKPWSMRFLDAKTGKLITESPFKAFGLMEKEGKGLFLREQLVLKPGEEIYGLGERFSAFTKLGQSVDMWNADCGTCSDKGYKDVPFFLSNRGWGVLVNDPGLVSFEMGTEQVERAQFSVPGQDFDWFLIWGEDPKGTLEKLGAISGRPALPPAWSFGLWLTTSFTTNYDEETVSGLVDGMKERNIPLHVFHFDCFWMKGHHWSNFIWDNETFPDPQGMLKRMKERGLKICVWINPYIGERSEMFAEGMKNGYLLKRPNGDVYQRHMWQAGMGYVDFTNPEAVKWYTDKLDALIDMGVDSFKTDFGEEIPTDVIWHDGSDPIKMHNYYTYIYNKCVFDLLVKRLGEHEACLFARSATATCQQFPVHWGGDCYGTYESMAESLRGGLSLALSGFGYWSHDIGGFESLARPEVYKRWVAFGLMSSHSRLHGSTSYRVPWLYDEEAVDVVRFFTQLKCRLMPYLLRVSAEAHQHSTPMMRAMLLEYPENPGCRTLDRQYMLGDALLVAPVFDDLTVEYYLPEGSWMHLLDGRVYEGNSWYTEDYSFMSLPVFIRENSILPLGHSNSEVVYDWKKELTLVCGLLDGKTEIKTEVCDSKGKSIACFQLTQNGKEILVKSLEGLNDWSLHLPWAEQAGRLEGCTVSDVALLPNGKRQGVLLKAQAKEISFTLS